MEGFKESLAAGRDVAFVIRKGALSYNGGVKYENGNKMMREEIIRHIVQASGEDLVISTTGKASRELFEIREANGQSHKCDFMTVGSMGHCSSVALGVALNKPRIRTWCIDGDGAVLMHMGAMAIIGANKPRNMIHIVINNGAHETVGGMPTVASKVDIDSLDKELEAAKERNALSLIEVKCSIGARADLGRPTTTTFENKGDFMKYLNP